MHFKISSVKCQPCCLGLNVLRRPLNNPSPWQGALREYGNMIWYEYSQNDPAQMLFHMWRLVNWYCNIRHLVTLMSIFRVVRFFTWHRRIMIHSYVPYLPVMDIEWYSISLPTRLQYMMTSSNGNIFRVTGHLCGEFTGLRWIPRTKPVTRSFDVSFDLHLNKRFSKQSWGWWFIKPSRPLWHHCNETFKCAMS